MNPPKEKPEAGLEAVPKAVPTDVAKDVPTIDLMQAADDVKALAKMFRSVLAIGDALEQVGNLRNAATEATRQRDAFRAERDALHAERDAAQYEVTAAHKRVADNQGESVMVLNTARAQAVRIVEDAKREAQRLTAATQADIAGRGTELAAARAERDRVNDDITAAKATLASLQSQIAAVKLAVATLAG